jgi:hypothetical protein
VRFKLHLIAICIVFNTTIFGQNIDWNKLSFGATFQYLNTNGDLGEYWGNSFAAGILLKYNLAKSISLEGGITGSYLKPISSVKSLPNIIFITTPIGLKYSQFISRILKTNVWGGIQNHSFLYSGEAAEIVGENDIEHELGLFAQIGFEIFIVESMGLEIYSKVQNIFTSPEELSFYSFGISIYFY